MDNTARSFWTLRDAVNNAVSFQRHHTWGCERQWNTKCLIFSLQVPYLVFFSASFASTSLALSAFIFATASASPDACFSNHELD
mmetsp:Transcript_42446/g.83283  ORF Transcript_42446/g.83283 Transcript_42446/m.83283 type:complete len:84 (-) Transcript_42446:398-649(-)